jgi:cell division protein FtsZ
MKEVGPAIMGSGAASGENRAAQAAKRAIDNQLLEDVGIDGAMGILINISATQESLTMAEFMEASALIQEKAHEEANIIIGALFDENLGEELRVTVIATGISALDESETISHINVARNRKTEVQPPVRRSQQETDPGFTTRSVSNAPPNAERRSPDMPPTVFDDREHENWDEPAYIRKKAN